MLEKKYGLGPILPFMLKKNLHQYKDNTYITCLSEHYDTEDGLGRLSMWRAYGGVSGVALVVNNNPFLQSNDGLGAFTFPVTYCKQDGYLRLFEHMRNTLLEKFDSYSSMESFDAYFSMLLKYHILCTKHPGFAEEREWRVVYTPGPEKPKYIQEEIHTVRGTPQSVYMLPVENITEIDFYAGIENLLDHIIIGPTPHPQVMKEAFVKILNQEGVTDAESKVVISDIPLRHYL
jgi:hypothetical protein